MNFQLFLIVNFLLVHHDLVLPSSKWRLFHSCINYVTELVVSLETIDSFEDSEELMLSV